MQQPSGNEWGASSEDKGRASANTTLSSPHSQKIAHHRRQLHKGSLQPRVRQVCALWNLSNSGKLSGRWGMQWGQRWWWEERCRSSLCAALCALHKASVTTSDSSPGRSLAASERSRWQRSWLPGKVPSYRISGPARARCQSFVFREVVPCWLLEAPPGGSSAWWLPVNNQLVLDQLPARACLQTLGLTRQLKSPPSVLSLSMTLNTTAVQ